jgi:hypothetical protein
MFTQFREASHNQQSLRRRCGIQLFMFENPRIAVRYENGMQTRGQRRIDVRLGTVTDHPCGIAREFVFLRQSVVRGGIFFRDNLRRREILFQPGALDLSRLLRQRSFRYQNRAMPGGKVLQRLWYLRQKFYGMISHRVSKAGDLGVQFRRNRLNREPLKRVHQRMRKAVQAIAVLHDAFPLHIVQHFPNLLGRKLVVIEKRNEARDGPLKVNVVLPERVVGIDQKSLCLICGSNCESS